MSSSDSAGTSDSESPAPRRANPRRAVTFPRPLQPYQGDFSGDEREEGWNSEVEVEALPDFLLNPPIETVLGVEEDGKYLIKLKGRSYLHLERMTREQILARGKLDKARLVRFERENSKKEVESLLFDPSFSEVDRVLSTTDLFRVVHPRPAAEVLEKWQGKLLKIMSILANFKKNGLCYGPFLYSGQESEAESEVSGYFVDFGRVINRLYNGYYPSPREFWLDLGMIFKLNAANNDEGSDLRIIGDTLRQVAISLYKQWHQNLLTTGQKPGPYTLRWVSLVPGVNTLSSDFLSMDLDGKRPFSRADEEEDRKLHLQVLSAEELGRVDLGMTVEPVFLVKWKGLSYLESTWEGQNSLIPACKIDDFYAYNKALDIHVRQAMINLTSSFDRLIAHQHSLSHSPKRSKAPDQSLSLLKATDFPTHNFDLPVINYHNSPKFSGGRVLRSYQIEGLNWLLLNWHSRKSCILADEMGLGKTVQALAFLRTLVQVYRLRGPYLVLAPLSVLSHWKKTAEDWMPELNLVVLHDVKGKEGREFLKRYEAYYTDIMKRGGTSHKSRLVKFHVLVTSFEVFKQDFPGFFRLIPFQFVVIDEAHRLKNKQAKIMALLKEFPCRRYALLTGTPLQNNTEELWTLLDFIQAEEIPSLKEFKTQFGSLLTEKQVDNLQRKLGPYILRRLKEDVEDSIPPLKETVIDVELTMIQKAYYRAIYERNRSFLSRGGIQRAPVLSLNNLEIQLRKCCNHPFLVTGVEDSMVEEGTSEAGRMARMVESSGKMVLIDKLLPKLKADGKKVLIFSQFTQMLDLLAEYLIYKKVSFERLDGSTRCPERQSSIDRFNDPRLLREVFLLSTRAGGIGINLTSAQVVIIFDSDWNPQNDVQATARAHRIGQTAEVLVYRLITARTYEATMFERASMKLGLEQALFSKENRGEVEELLKHGAYSLIDEDSSKSQRFVESNIEDILEKNSHVVTYTLVRGSYSLGKSTFVSDSADQSIDVHDPEFWSKVLPRQISVAAKLQERLEDPDFKDTNGFMLALKAALRDQLQAKVDMNGGSHEEEEIMISLISQVSQNSAFSKKQQQTAVRWMNDLYKSTRSSRTRTSAPLIQSDSEEEAKQEKQTPAYSSFHGTGSLCAVCKLEGGGWFCTGPCRRTFHTNCLKGVPQSASQVENEERDRDLVLGRISQKWQCGDCTNKQGICSVCGGKGLYRYPQDLVSRPRADYVVLCSAFSCGRSMHAHCFKMTGKRFTCPSHTCDICGSADDPGTLLQCVKCPIAFHKSCSLTEAVRVNKKYALCEEHAAGYDPVVYGENGKNEAFARQTARRIRAKLREFAPKVAELSLLRHIPS